MPHTSPFFSNTTGYSGENTLIDDLVREQIKIYGVDLIFMPRKLVNLDQILHESSKSAFEFGLPIPTYIKTFDGFDNGNELLTKFGIRSADRLTFQISRTEFQTYYSPFLKSYYQSINSGGDVDPLKGQTADRPKEGDLLYFPFDDSIFEIKYVQFDVPFYQLGKGYIFELECERFEYSGEEFSTGYSDIDDTTEDLPIFKTQFTVDLATGSGTYAKFETVTIYDVSDVETPTTTPPDPIDQFRLYNDSGYLEGVDTLTAKVVTWNKVTGVLVVENITNNDPLQRDENYDLNVDKLANVLIVGQTSTASFLTTAAAIPEQRDDDTTAIQTEFDLIKVEDAADQNPFGFE
jgi:hypothetical protein